MSPLSGRQEWASRWPLPLTAMLGACGSTMYAYSSGTFMLPMTTAFGWTRAQFSVALVLQLLSGVFIVPVLGWITDRTGPRRVALFGVVPYTIAFSLLGFADRSISHWWLLCLLVAVTQAPISGTIWVTAVIGRFEASRGLALSVTLAGLALGTLIWPLLSAFCIATLGWRMAFPALAAGWAVIVFPLTLLFFHGPPRPAVGLRSKAHARSYAQALKSRTFVLLMIAGGLFASAYFGVLVNLVPILRLSGLGPTAAAAVGGLVGVFAIIGRISAGYMLDRLPSRPVAIVAFLLPALASLLLLRAQGSATLSLISVILFGLAAGAETDVITFIAARRFGHKVFASVYSVFMVVIAICSSSGPIIAALVFDHTKSYDLYLAGVPALVIVGAALFAWIPVQPVDDRAEWTEVAA